jgi:queuine tRNA-ribosyltransferase
MQEQSSGEVVAARKERLAHVDDDGVTFKSHLDGSLHRFTPEVSMRVQHDIGADIIFAFDELTTLMNSREYQVQSVERTYQWAQRCVTEHERLTREHPERPRQALFGVVQGAQYEDLRRLAARQLGALPFAGFGIGGAIEKTKLGEIVRWVVDELPADKPRHLLGIGEPNDLFTAVEEGVDTFDCVAPTRNARNSAVMTQSGRFNLLTSASRRAFVPIDDQCDCYTCLHYTRAYLHHAFKAKEMIASTLASIHNERFIVGLVDRARAAIIAGNLAELRTEFLGRYYAGQVSDSR